MSNYNYQIPIVEGELTIVFKHDDGTTTTVEGIVKNFAVGRDVDYEDENFHSPWLMIREESYQGSFTFVRNKGGQAFTVRREQPKAIHTATVRLPAGMDGPVALAAARKRVNAPEDAFGDVQKFEYFTDVTISWGHLD